MTPGERPNTPPGGDIRPVRRTPGPDPRRIADREWTVVDLAGPWRTAPADDEMLRIGIGLDVDDDDWDELIVPGHWRSNARYAASDGPVLHRRRFDTSTPAEGRRRWVSLDGIFYQGDVWFDGAYLGDTEGYFVPHVFDVTALSQLDDEHVLAIEATCSPQRNKRAKRNITGVFQHWDCIDPDFNPGGIWRGVRIEETGPVRIDTWSVLCRDANESRAHLVLHARVDSDSERHVRLVTRVDEQVIGEEERTLATGINEIDWTVDIDDPALWWPWSLGPQNLCRVEIDVLVDGDLSHRRSVRTGLREISVQDWIFSVNGERIYVKGANLAPTRAALAEATVSELRRDFELARDA
ncbi:MAG: glycosyl hydrolase 2 galactose-binding domain-containing protein, partial [Ilumatobacteraceae bacterium]